MELQGTYWYLRSRRLPVLEGELVAAIRELAGRGVGSKTIARTVGIGAIRSDGICASRYRLVSRRDRRRDG